MRRTGHAGVDLLLHGGVVDGVLAVAALELAHATDAHIIECLVAAGADERRIADYYARRLLVPVALPDQLLHGDGLSLLPGDMALEFFAIPVGREPDGALVVAMADPADLHARDEIAFFAGVDVLRAVATMSAIRSALETRYDLELTEMFVPVGVVAQAARPAPPQLAPVGSAPAPPIDELRRATSAAMVSELVARWFAAIGMRAVVLVRRRNRFVAAAAAGVDAAALAFLSLDAAQPSVVRDVIRADIPYLGTVAGDPLAAAGLAGELLILPIVVGKRAIAIVLCDRPRGVVSQPFVRACVREAALAYERIIGRRFR